MRESDPKTPLAAALRQLRRSRPGVSQDVLSEQSGIPQTTLSRHESGESEPHSDQLKAYLDALNATLDERRVLGDLWTGAASSEEPAPISKVA